MATAKAASPEESPIDGLSFEQALGELEGIVDQLERGTVDLEQSITLYERGTRLKDHCDAKLNSAQARIEKIVAAPDGGVDTAPADLD